MRYTGGETENLENIKVRSCHIRSSRLLVPGSGAMSSVAQAELEIAEPSLYHSSVKIIVPWPG